jgi:hypothetical protein
MGLASITCWFLHGRYLSRLMSQSANACSWLSANHLQQTEHMNLCYLRMAAPERIRTLGRTASRCRQYHHSGIILFHKPGYTYRTNIDAEAIGIRVHILPAPDIRVLHQRQVRRQQITLWAAKVFRNKTQHHRRVFMTDGSARPKSHAEHIRRRGFADPMNTHTLRSVDMVHDRRLLKARQNPPWNR